MGVSTTSNLNSLYNLIFEDSMFVAQEAALMPNIVRVFDDNQTFAARKVSKYTEATAESVAEGVDFAGSSDFGKTLAATLTPSEVVAKFVLTDVMVKNSGPTARRDAALTLGNAMAQKMDTDIVGTFTSFTTDKGPGAGQTMTLAKAGVAMAVLRNTKTPAPLYVVLHPYQWHDIWVELGQPAATKSFLGEVANQAMRDYFVSDMLGATWFVSANIDVDSSDDAIGAVFNPNAIALDMREAPKLETERDASLRATELVLVAGYAVGVIRPEFGVKLTSDASEPS